MENYDTYLTIAIPTYNRKHELCNLLDAIQQQICEGVEVIVSDNASNDGTDLAMCNYKWVKYHKNHENLGADRNFLKCYDLATGEYVWLLGSDDIVTDKSISVIVEFLKEVNKPLDLVYLNHYIFLKDDNCTQRIVKKFLASDDSFVLSDKNRFIEITKARITFMSCILLRRECFNRARNVFSYIGTSFIHTCIFFESTKNDDSSFGVIGYPCVGANATEGAAGLDHDINQFLTVFSKKMKYVLCDVAIRNNYNKKLMNNIYINEIYRIISFKILKSKLDKSCNIKNTFWNDVFPSVKEYPKAWFTIIAAYFVPTFGVKFLYRYVRPVYQRLKRNID